MPPMTGSPITTSQALVFGWPLRRQGIWSNPIVWVAVLPPETALAVRQERRLGLAVDDAAAEAGAWERSLALLQRALVEAATGGTGDHGSSPGRSIGLLL